MRFMAATEKIAAAPFNGSKRRCSVRVLALAVLLLGCFVPTAEAAASASGSHRVAASFFARQHEQQKLFPRWRRFFSRRKRRPTTDTEFFPRQASESTDANEQEEVSDAVSDSTALSSPSVGSRITFDTSTCLEEEEEDDSHLSWWQPALSALTAVRASRWTATGLQLGLVCYIAHAVYKAASEVLDEYNSSLQTMTSTTDPVWMRREQVNDCISFLEQVLLTGVTNTATIGSDANLYLGKTVPQRVLLQVAEKLLRSGLPLRSSSERETSVESVLRSVTRSEAALLQQCLWVPSSRDVAGNTSATSSSKMDQLTDLWKDICGLHTAKQDLLQAVARVRSSSRRPRNGQEYDDEDDQYASLFDKTSTGILLYGPPGCGKTMLVKALSATAHIPCLVVTPSALLRKYVGETNQQVRSLFGLLQKLAPAILCLDELDGLFRERSQQEHEVSRDLKTEFLQWWDGMLTTGSRSNVLVVGATNRPFDVDSAVLRRLPQSHFVGLPNLAARTQLLERLLQKVPTAPEFQVYPIAVATSGYTPSDLSQVLQTAAWNGPLREQLLTEHTMSSSSKRKPRALRTADVLQAVEKVPPTPVTHQYRQDLDQFSSSNTESRVSDEPSQDWYYGTPHHGRHDSLLSDDNTGKWETGTGNFYNIGTIHIDRDSFERIRDLWEEEREQFQDDSLDDNDTDDYHDDDL